MSRKTFLVTVASAALIAASVPSAYAQLESISGEINPFGAEINPFSGTMNALNGEINPFSGEINPFYGEVSPFWGEVSPFWGDINPFSGDISPFWGDINPFGGEISPFTNGAVTVGSYWQGAGVTWGGINKKWGQLDRLSYGVLTQTQFNSVQADFLQFVNNSRAVWNNAVVAKTGQTFNQAFANPLFAKYGLNPNNPASFANLKAEQRSRFFLDWYDGLMAYSGSDIVDHWMATVKWNPAITQDQGSGHDAVVGILDMRVSTTDDNVQYLTNVGGHTTSVNNHGAAVASIIAGRHDGEGVMGIAPRATVLAYNPFNNGGRATLADVESGIQTLVNSGANVINMSLGFKGNTLHQSMINALARPGVKAHHADTVFVIAAGNEGTVQTKNLSVTSQSDIGNMIIVGSVDPNKNISFFSNTAGEACITIGAVCQETNKLKYRFLVAPGELILTSNNNGGTTRVSGTSFAAPIVTGAISLVHDRWPWLQNYAKETVDILFQTAEDLGAPGVDAVYGHGLLDVEAAVSPISFSGLTFYQPTATGGYTPISATRIESLLQNAGQLNLWQAQGAHLKAFEYIGNTYRDFMIPLSTLLDGQSVNTGVATERFQRHVNKRLVDWSAGRLGVAQSDEVTFAQSSEWAIAMTAAPVSSFAPSQAQDRPFDSMLRFTQGNGRTEIVVGEGMGALMLTPGGSTRSLSSDPTRSGHNPLLGLASGGIFAGVTRELTNGLDVTFGFTERTEAGGYVDGISGEYLTELPGMEEYSATAVTMNFGYRASKRLRLNSALTYLDESAGMLGARAGGLLSMSDGARSSAVTVSANYDVTPRFSLSASATAGRTEAGGHGYSPLTIGEDGLTTTAFELAASGRDLLRLGDDLRLSLSQPLYTESGNLAYDAVGVVDRTTGEIGSVSEEWAIGGGARSLVAEAEYGTPIGDNAEIRLFGRVDIGAVDAEGSYDAVAAGARYESKF